MQYEIINLATKSCLTNCQTLREHFCDIKVMSTIQDIETIRKLFLTLLIILLPMVANADATIEGIYEVQPKSYRAYNGNTVSYSSLEYNDVFTVKITDNLDGTYHVDDLFGGYYSLGKWYGMNYSMGGNIIVGEDGTVSLIDSYIRGWGDSLVGLIGTYDAETSSFSIEVEYIGGMKFYQTWVKNDNYLQGPVFSFNGINYQVLNGSNSVSVISKRLKYSGDVIIPDKVVYAGENYFVAVIAKEAFYNCPNLTSVVIPQSVMTIGSYSFERCQSLTSIIIPHNVTSIGIEAFGKCDKLKDVYCMPEQVRDNDNGESNGLYTYPTAFLDSNQEQITLHVSAASIEAYRAIEPWKNFGAIVALSDNAPQSTAIKTNNNNPCYPVDTYSIDGKRLQNEKLGLNIIKMNDGSTKIVIKR